MTIPQLRVRTEFSFRKAFGPVAGVADRLAAIGCPAAAIVDEGTWGHTRWAKEMARAGVRPMYGTELAVPQPSGLRPTAWALGVDLACFYRFSSAARHPDADLTELFRTTTGVIRFAGAALTDPETFDYIDLNPSSRLAQRRGLALAKATGKPLVITSDNFYPGPSDYAAFMAIVSREKLTPQHLLTEEELRKALALDDEDFKTALRNTHEVAERAASELPRAPTIHFPGDLRALAEEGRQYRLAHGHIKEWNDEYANRLERELHVIEQKHFQSYFLVVADLVQWAKRYMLVGPARGSSAGSLLCYLIRITEVDPLIHGLLFERFIDLTREDLPDIDIDFSDKQREKCFTYLIETYGRENVARIGNISTLKPRSVLSEVGKRLGIPIAETFPVRNVLFEYSSGDSRYGKGLEDTFANTENGRYFMSRHPAADIMTVVENHAWHHSVHAAGVIVSNTPVVEYCTVMPNGVAQIDKPGSEQLGLLKIDALGLRTLGLIEDSGVVTAEELYSLPLDDPKVFEIFNAKKYCGIFQFEGQAQRVLATQVAINQFQTIDHVTALARPGPLGGGAAAHYVRRHNGQEPITSTHPSTYEVLKDTYGVVLYQEQVMRIVQEVGKFTWEETTIIRKAISGRKGKEFFDRQCAKFIAGAARDKIDARTAQDIWEEICNFGSWGMNRSHTCSYSIISYWCAWLKAYHPIAYAAACLRNAKDDAQVAEILRELQGEGVPYVAFDIDKSELDWSVQDGVLVGGFMNLVGFGPAKATEAVAARIAEKLTGKLLIKVMAAEIKFVNLYPIRTAWSHVYDDPVQHAGCRDGSRVMMATEFPDEGEVLWLGKVMDKKKRDENELVLVMKRKGKRREGLTAFVDLAVKDDTDVPIIARINRFKYDEYGAAALRNLIPEEDVVLIRGRRIRDFPMIQVDRIKCLSRPEVFS